MKHNSQTWAATMVGAAIGALAGYMFFTEEGRAWRRRLEPQLEDAMKEFQQFRGTLAKASSAASEGWRILNDAMQDPEAVSSDASYGRSGQTHPF